MKILVVGSGAREHALCWRLARDPGVRVTCAPGNAGMARTVEVAPLDPGDPDAVLALARTLQADLTVIGPEAPLAAGVVDRFIAAGRPIFGPTAAAAALETSKAFAKEFMTRHGVPTARFACCETAAEAIDVLDRGSLGASVVVKADGLAAGKGVVVAPDRATAEAAVRAAMVDRAFGAAGSRIVLEECLTGPEVSFFVVASGENYVPLVSAQDHKRIFDGDNGPNTGGMGAFAPSPLVTPEMQQRIEREIVGPVLSGMAAEGRPFTGFLYTGLMITTDGPKVIEFNVRFGDPEAQVVLPLIEQPLAPLLMEAAEKTPGSIFGGGSDRKLNPASFSAVGVVLAAHGYPGEVRQGDAIGGLEHLEHEYPDVLTFYAGVKARGNELVTSGGRVMTLVSTESTYERAIARVYDAASRVRFEGMQYRTDIGRKAVVGQP